MKTLETGQAVLQARRGLALVDMVRLRTFTDRDAGTVQSTRYYSTRWFRYDYGNVGTDVQVEPFLVRVSEEVSEMDHLPAQNGDDSALVRRLQVVLRNGTDDTPQRLYKTLRALNLEMAEIEWSQLFLDTGPGPTPPDLRSLAGSEHTVRFRGHVEVVSRVDDGEIELTCASRLPQIPWIVASNAAINDPRDVGRRLPILYGAMNRAQAVGWQVGWVTTLAIPCSTTATTLDVTDGTGLSTAGAARLGTEEIAWTGRTANQLTGVTRGLSNSVAAVHDASEPVIELIATNVFVLAGHALSALRNLYVLSPIDGQLLRLTTPYTLNLANTALISGKTVATATFDTDQFRSLITLVIKAAETRISQQPVVSHVVPGGTEDNADQLPIVPTQAAVRDNNFTTSFQLSTGFAASALLTITFAPPPAGTSNGQRLRLWFAGWSNIATAEIIGVGPIIPGTDYTEIQTPLLGDSHILRIVRIGASPGYCNVVEVHRRNTYGVQPPTLTQLVAVISRTAAVGFELRIHADIDGPVATGGNYSVANGVVLTRAPDILRHIIAELCGLGHGAIDASSFSDAVTNLGTSTAHALALEVLGESFAEIIARIAYDARANIMTEERSTGTVYRMLTALSTYAFGTTLRTLDDFSAVVEEAREARSISTRFRFLYDWDPTRGDVDDPEAYVAVVRIDEDQNDVTVPSTATVSAAEARYGRKDASVVLFPTIHAEATAEERAGYYAVELMRVTARRVARDVPWTLAYDLERGDIVTLTPSWDTVSAKHRVLGVSKDPNEMCELVLAEVP